MVIVEVVTGAVVGGLVGYTADVEDEVELAEVEVDFEEEVEEVDEEDDDNKGGLMDAVDDVELFEETEDVDVAGLPWRLEVARALEGGAGLALSFATSPLGGLLGGITDLAGGFPYAVTISRMRCAFASAASTIWDEAETSSDSYSVVGGSGWE